MKHFNADDLDDVFDDIVLSGALKLPLRHIRNWQDSGEGPPFLKFGKHIRYRKADVLRWLHEQEVSRLKERIHAR
jgi:hypothetical protein